MSTRPPLVSLCMASAAALGYQVLLLRLFSIVQWHHFAYMIISLALLGFGASGTVLTLARVIVLRHLRIVYVTSIALFAGAAVPAFLLAQGLAFNPEELLWQPRLMWRLAGLYLILSLPFFFVACAVGLVLMHWGRMANRVYGVDLAGAAAGAATVLGLLWFIPPLEALGLMAALGFLAAWVAGVETGLGSAGRMLIAAVAIVTGVLWLAGSSAGWLEMSPSPYKDLNQALQIAGARVETTRSSPHGLVSVVANDRVPLRLAPGLSLRATVEPPAQRALFVDGNAASAFTRDIGEPDALGFLHAMPSALPFVMDQPRRVLVLDAGGGLLALQARFFGATSVQAVESNPDIIRLARDTFDDFSGHLYTSPPVEIVRADPRAFLAATGATYDLIQLPAAGGLGAGAAAHFALSEDYLRTTEAMEAMLRRLAPGGLLVMHAWMQLPPRDSLRLAGTLIEALGRVGVAEPANSMMAIRSWQMATLIASDGAFAPRDVALLRRFAGKHGYDVAYYPGMSREEANRINRLPQPYLHDAIVSHLQGDYGMAEAYKFDIRPISDDRPFFNNFLRWRTVPEIIPLVRSGGMPLLEAGYVLLLAALLQAIVLGMLLIVVPLMVGPTRRDLAGWPTTTLRTMCYFTAIGFGFMFIELAAIHQFLIYLEEPVYATAVVLTAFLACAGLGSYTGARFVLRIGERRTSALAAIAVIAIGLSWVWLLDSLLAAAAAWPFGLKIVVTLSVIAPLAFAMGQLFPAAISCLSRERPHLVPWAWAVNGCASVVGAVLATVLSVAIGFDGCLLAAIGLYALTIAVFPVRSPAAGAGVPIRQRV